MLKTLMSTMVLVSVAITALTASAAAHPRFCPMPIMKGGCPAVVTEGGPYLPTPVDR